ncbi:MAG: alpha/beta fold hydrolase [Bacteroidota bacterium]
MQHRLLDGRELAYAEYGDPAGKPVFFFHGAPGSNFFHPPVDVTRRMGVRLICVDRPGYGGSTFQPKRKILDWPRDVASLADALGLGSFAVTGHSAGSPHTLACAYSLPARVRAAAVLCGVGPVDAPGAIENTTFINRLGFQLGRYSPWPLVRAMVWVLFHRQAADPAKAIDLDQRERVAADEEVLKIPGVRENCIESDIGAYRQGLLGYAWDVNLIIRPWGIPLEQIQVPVHFWHGTADNFAAVHMARHMADRIPDAKAFILEGEGHMLLIPHWEEILGELLNAWK